jgi:hypothetical protein
LFSQKKTTKKNDHKKKKKNKSKVMEKKMNAWYDKKGAVKSIRNSLIPDLGGVIIDVQSFACEHSLPLGSLASSASQRPAWLALLGPKSIYIQDLHDLDRANAFLLPQDCCPFQLATPMRGSWLGVMCHKKNHPHVKQIFGIHVTDGIFMTANSFECSRIDFVSDNVLQAINVFRQPIVLSWAPF